MIFASVFVKDIGLWFYFDVFDKFGIRVILVLENVFGSVPSFYFLEDFAKDWCYFFLTCLVEVTSEDISVCAFFVGSFLITSSMSSLVTDLLICSVSF